MAFKSIRHARNFLRRLRAAQRCVKLRRVREAAWEDRGKGAAVPLSRNSAYGTKKWGCERAASSLGRGSQGGGERKKRGGKGYNRAGRDYISTRTQIRR